MRGVVGPRVSRPCNHGGAHPHGDENRYRMDGCRCAPCTEAARRSHAKWELRILQHGPDLVDPTPAVTRLKEWQSRGMGSKAIAKHTGLSTSTVETWLYGREDPRRRQVDPRIHRRTASAILTAPEPRLDDFLPAARVDSTGTARRLQALYALGWSVHAVADRAGLSVCTLRDVPTRSSVTAATALAVRAVYDLMWDRTPQPRTPAERGVVTRTRRQAAAKGWAPPLAWDDEDLDNPTAKPNISGGTGARRVHVEDVEWILAAYPLTTTRQLTERLGVGQTSVFNHLKRKGRRDLLAQLARNAELAGAGNQYHHNDGRAA